LADNKNKFQQYLSSLGKQIKKFRKEKNLTLEELGLNIGLDRSAMHNMEKGQNITIATLIKLSLVLGKKPNEFLDLDFNFKNPDLGGLVTSKRSPKRKRPAKKKKK
jgi:transcriptional regulator with XRE-family HTH domain